MAPKSDARRTGTPQPNALVETQLEPNPSTGRAGRRPIIDTSSFKTTPAPVGIKDFGSGSAVSTRSSPGLPASYTIRNGDNLWNIAKHFYGRGELYTHIVKRNPSVKIHPGKELIIPVLPSGAQATSTSARTATTTASTTNRYGNIPPGRGKAPARNSATQRSPRVYMVKKGETLWRIAERMYGDPTKYVRILEANPQLTHPVKVRAGEKITIP